MDYSGVIVSEVRYEQVQRVARGSFAEVASIAGTELVIKVASNGAYDHFLREKRVYERLGHHRYILKCYGVSRIVSSKRAKVGLLLQYHPTGTLADMLSLRHFPDDVDRTKWLRQATEAVGYIHSKGIIHGDLGCHNFLVQNDGTLALADFGGSRINCSDCLELPLARYTRPVVITQLGVQPTERDDLFALGTVLFEITTCQQLYRGKSDTEIHDLFARQIFPNLDPITRNVRLAIEKCWESRYSNAEEVSRDLHFPIRESIARAFFGYIGLLSTAVVIILTIVVIILDFVEYWGISSL